MSITVIRENRPASRGRVRCDVCCRTIARGTTYTAQTCAYDERAWTWRECDDCHAAAPYVHDYVGTRRLDEEGVGPDDWPEWADEALAMSLWPPARTLDEAAARLAEADRDNPLTGSDEAWAALRWLARTSRALYPEAVAA